MDLNQIGSQELRLIVRFLRNHDKCVTPELLDRKEGAARVATLNSEGCRAAIKASMDAGKLDTATLDRLAVWAANIIDLRKGGKGGRSGMTEAQAAAETVPVVNPCACGHAEERHSKTSGCLFKAPGRASYCVCPAFRRPEVVESRDEKHVETAQAQTALNNALVSGKPRPPVGSIDAMIDARIEERLAGFKPETAITPDQVRDIVNEVALATAQEIKIVIARPDGVQVECKGEHFQFARLVRLMGAGIHVYLWGPAGSGKTTAAINAAKALGKTCEIDTLDPSTPKSSVLGYRTPNGDPAETAFTRMYASGGIYVGDECDNAPAHVQTLFNSALANGHAPCAWGQVARGPGFSLVGTGNTPGRPTPSFPDRRPMSAAFADRLYFLYWPLDPGIECRAAGIPVPRYPTRKEATCTASEWVVWVRAIRDWAERNAPTLMITPRASLLGMQALALGETPEEAANGLVFRGADKTLIEKALNAVPLPG